MPIKCLDLVDCEVAICPPLLPVLAVVDAAGSGFAGRVVVALWPLVTGVILAVPPICSVSLK